MLCQNCGKPAMFGIGPDGKIPVCLDCYIKLSEAQDRVTDQLEREHNLIADEMEMLTGLPGVVPRYPSRQRPQVVLSENVTLHHINIANSNVGVVNTGTIGSIDSAVGVLKTTGSMEAAAAFKTLTEAVANAANVDAELKEQIFELLSVLSAEAAAPKARRRSRAMCRIVAEVANLVGGIAGISQLWQQYGPAITALFQS